VPLNELTSAQVQNLTGAALNYIVAGVAIGLVSRILVRSATALREASQEALVARERAARLEERETLARRIHDSVLQALTYIHKRGRELATAPVADPAEVMRLAEMAAQEEVELRSLILRDPDDAPTGLASLREALEASARKVGGIDVTVSSVGPLHLPAAIVGEVAAAVGQALTNVAAHSGAEGATVFAEIDGPSLVVTVRDKGRGFEYDEAKMREAGKAGILRSMKGRAEDLGGRMTIDSSPETGTEVEFRIPLSEGDQ
jgi:signal transduction histidine kinase